VKPPNGIPPPPIGGVKKPTNTGPGPIGGGNDGDFAKQLLAKKNRMNKVEVTEPEGPGKVLTGNTKPSTGGGNTVQPNKQPNPKPTTGGGFNFAEEAKKKRDGMQFDINAPTISQQIKARKQNNPQSGQQVDFRNNLRKQGSGGGIINIPQQNEVVQVERKPPPSRNVNGVTNQPPKTTISRIVEQQTQPKVNAPTTNGPPRVTFGQGPPPNLTGNTTPRQQGNKPPPSIVPSTKPSGTGGPSNKPPGQRVLPNAFGRGNVNVGGTTNVPPPRELPTPNPNTFVQPQPNSKDVLRRINEVRVAQGREHEQRMGEQNKVVNNGGTKGVGPQQQKKPFQ
jgi:hypothetical protein